MPKTGPFDNFTADYDAWFETNLAVYESELAAIRTLLSAGGVGIEIGVGTGRFAAPLGVRFGIEPSRTMAIIAQQRGIKVAMGVAEQLPLCGLQLDFALMVTTICFLDDLATAFKEGYRVLKPGGRFLIGLVDRHSQLGKVYEEHKSESVFYRNATFHSVAEVVSCLEQAGFNQFAFAQTIFGTLSDIHAPQPVKNGYGKGAFVVIRAMK